MRRCMTWIALAAMMAACSAKREVPANAAAPPAGGKAVRQRAANIAYEHAIELEVPGSRTRQVFDAVRQSCAALPAHGCTVLEASIRSGASAGATVRMRMVPDGVDKVLRTLDGQGKVETQSTHGEDLAEPIGDVERKMTMLTHYRDQLQALASRHALEPDALIKLNRELAEVQSQIDDVATSRAQLARRVDTDLLTVALHERASAGDAGGIRRALDDFGGDFLHGVAMLITFVASTIPFALAGAVFHAIWRRVRRRRRNVLHTSEKT